MYRLVVCRDVSRLRLRATRCRRGRRRARPCGGRSRRAHPRVPSTAAPARRSRSPPAGRSRSRSSSSRRPVARLPRAGSSAGRGLWGDLAFAIVVTTGDLLARPPGGGVASWTRTPAGRFRARSRRRSSCSSACRSPGSRARGGSCCSSRRSLVWAVCQFVYWLREKRPRSRRGIPVFWQAEVVGVVLLAIVLFVAPSVGSADRRAAGGAGGRRRRRRSRTWPSPSAFRPLLFFDSGERRFPLDIQDAIARRPRADLPQGGGRRQLRDRGERELRSTRTRTTWSSTRRPARRAAATTTSAIYYHVTRPRGTSASTSTTGGSTPATRRRSRTRSSAGPACAAAVHLPGARRRLGGPDRRPRARARRRTASRSATRASRPEEVRYGQHEHVRRLRLGRDARPLWGSLDVPPGGRRSSETWEERRAPGDRRRGRPPDRLRRAQQPCLLSDARASASCKQTTRELPEAPHNGAVPWAHNEECDECVKRAPAHRRTGEPALWNAFPGRWGEQHCILAGAYCDLSGAPKGPSFQTRYKEPARRGRWRSAFARDSGLAAVAA